MVMQKEGPVTVICPHCRQRVAIDVGLRHVIASIRKIGCDDCLRKLAYGAIAVGLAPAT